MEKGFQGRKIREKGELGERHLWFGDILVYGKVRKCGEKEGGGQETVFVAMILLTFFLEDSHRGTLLLVILGSGARKP